MFFLPRRSPVHRNILNASLDAGLPDVSGSALARYLRVSALKMNHQYLFGFEIHELCRNCPGTCYAILSWEHNRGPTLSTYACGFCDSRNWELDRYSYYRY